jgi:hypothetical protein
MARTQITLSLVRCLTGKITGSWGARQSRANNLSIENASFTMLRRHFAVAFSIVPN